MPFVAASDNTRYFHAYRDESGRGFSANIIMNPRDAMVFAEITGLPERQEDAQEIMAEFLRFLKKEYGGKRILRIPPELMPMVNTVLAPGAFDSRFSTKEQIQQAIEKVKEPVQRQLARLHAGEIKLLDNEALKTRANELSTFKILYSSFANVAKIENGQYSEFAEYEKLENPYVKHFAVEVEGQIGACVMYVVHGDMLYVSDFIVRKDLREQGLAQAMIIKTLQQLVDAHSQIKGGWYVAGGYGQKGVGAHLYSDVFPSISLREEQEQQQKQGLFVEFGGPGSMLLVAANRDLATQKSLDETRYIEAALADLKLSQEPSLGAQPPKPSSAVSVASFYQAAPQQTEQQPVQEMRKPSMSATQ